MAIGCTGKCIHRGLLTPLVPTCASHLNSVALVLFLPIPHLTLSSVEERGVMADEDQRTECVERDHHAH